MECNWARGGALFFLQFLQSVLVWPAAVLVLALLFKSQVGQFISRIDSGKFGSLEWRSTPPSQVIQQNDASEDVLKALHFERLYNSIYGSQWQTLWYLYRNLDIGVSMQQIQDSVEDWMSKRGTTNYVFSEWVEWLIRVGLIAVTGEGTNRVARITADGRLFLSYIVQRYPPEPPPRFY